MLDLDITTEICLLKGNDVARMLNIRRAFAYQLMRQGEIPTVRIVHAVLHRSLEKAVRYGLILRNSLTHDYFILHSIIAEQYSLGRRDKVTPIRGKPWSEHRNR